MNSIENIIKAGKDSAAEELELYHNAPGLVTFLPMLYIAWSDGILTPSEFETIQKTLQVQNWITKHEKEILSKWLDPSVPPSCSQLRSWLKIIRTKSREIPESTKHSGCQFFRNSV